MLLKYFYDDSLAHASYLVGCQRSGVAIVVDPGRNVGRYLKAASREGLRLTGVAETHIHADYVSGARELADRTGATLYLSDEGPAEWKYRFAEQSNSVLLRDGDHFSVGKIEFEVLHTPGHTPESVSFLLTDRGGGADVPMGIFTGDFVFVGSIGRPDLLEEAAGVAGSAEPSARELFRSIEKFRQLPDFLQVWPTHGAGSACGKGLGAIPSSTVGYEKLFNPALQYQNEDDFVKYILSDQPQAPKYFAIMKQVNREGPRLISDLPKPKLYDTSNVTRMAGQATVIDLSPSEQFASCHVPGTWNIPLPMLAAWAGWLVDYSRPVYLIGQERQFPEAIRLLRSIGVDQIGGCFDVESIVTAQLTCEGYRSAAPHEVADQIASGSLQLIDVRSDDEWYEGNIPNARHHFLGHLQRDIDEIAPDTPVVTQCRSGSRSAIAASILQAAGFGVINLSGGYAAWNDEGFPIQKNGTDQETSMLHS